MIALGRLDPMRLPVDPQHGPDGSPGALEADLDPVLPLDPVLAHRRAPGLHPREERDRSGTRVLALDLET